MKKKVFREHKKQRKLSCTPKVRQKKSNFRGVFIMKLTYEDKVQIYELRNQGYSLEQLSNKFGINISNLSYMIKLIDRYGIEIAKKGKNRYYFPELKQEMIDKVLFKGYSQDRVSLKMLSQIVERFLTGSYTIRKTGTLLLRRQEKGYLKWDVSQRKN